MKEQAFMVWDLITAPTNTPKDNNWKDDKEWTNDVHDHIRQNNELIENKYFEEMEHLPPGKIILMASFEEDNFLPGSTEEEIRDAIFNNIEALTQDISINFIRRDPEDQGGQINITTLGQ